MKTHSSTYFACLCISTEIAHALEASFKQIKIFFQGCVMKSTLKLIFKKNFPNFYLQKIKFY